MKQKAYSVINILGLALGLAACILVGLYIWQEMHYDDYYDNGDQIYRISDSTKTPQGTFTTAETPALIAPTLNRRYPEIRSISRVYFPDKDLIIFEDKKFYEEDLIFADAAFFNIFSYSFNQGSAETALLEKNSIVITNSIAKKYFGTSNPVGKSLSFNNSLELKVTGVIEEIPRNSHFTFNMVATYSSLVDLPVGNYLDQWGATFGSYTYVMINPETDPVEFSEKISPFLNSEMQVFEGVYKSFILQPINSIHLYSDLEGEIKPNSSISYLAILGSIALFILILACINFVNLTTARAVKRAREIGVRKVFGAEKHQLIKQFIGESIMITLISLACALVIVELFVPFFNSLIGTELTYFFFSNIRILTIIILATVIIGILSGLYPAFVLTHFQPARVLKGTMHDGKSGSSFLRKFLVLLQYSISLILIIFTIFINQQIRFMRNFDMGFDKDAVIVLNTPERMSYNSETIKAELNLIPGVIKTSTSLGVPVMGSGFGTNLTPDLAHEDEKFRVSVRMIDHEYLDFYGITLLAGKTLSELGEADFTTKTMVNETTVRKLGFASPEEALGNNYTIGLSDGVKRFAPEIVGVVQDFHFNSLHEEVSPLLFMYWPYLFKEISIKISSKNVPATINEIKAVWEKFYPVYPFDFAFLDDKIDAMYKAEERSYKVISTFSVLAIFIACLGLLGLTFYATEQRRKEIGIRKVLGASIANISNMISIEFLKIVIIANLIAWPVSYFIVGKWLATFSYKIQINLTVFFAAGLLTLLISFLTISYTVIKSATANPIESLSYE
ncbi:ABC transporter permease [Candidatus Woesearchaeota archaeon]|nr:ABC transporter permease [Candidatus Woesearchaeota archaeon]